MKTLLMFLFVVSIGSSAWHQSPGNRHPGDPPAENTLTGQWLRFGPAGPISLNFNENGTVEGDFDNDGSVDIISEYTIENDRISFADKEGVACPEPGTYRMTLNEYYLSFDLVDDECGGRVQATMGFWVRPNYEEIISGLSERISASGKSPASGEPSSAAVPEDHLNRARMYLALGKSYEARQDFDRYIAHNPGDARILVNRAATRFPTDLEGVVSDCNKAIELDPENKNAYFLRGLAHYSLGDQKQACEDFYRAIERGFAVLKEAEKERCAEFWESQK